ncbi:uncharacterized protein [Procambarus clarkii]|uniref:uncharacterized protein n=1 Tax=Procambarus clarkii TaxID=6728 RepID=UPI00374366C0
MERIQLELQMQREDKGRQFQLEMLRLQLQMKNEGEKEKSKLEVEKEKEKTTLEVEKEKIKVEQEKEKTKRMEIETNRIVAEHSIKRGLPESTSHGSHPLDNRVREKDIQLFVLEESERFFEYFEKVEGITGTHSESCTIWCKKGHSTDGTPDRVYLASILEDESEDRQVIVYSACVVAWSEVADKGDIKGEVTVSTPLREETDVEIAWLFSEGPARENEGMTRSDVKMTRPEKTSVNRVDLEQQERSSTAECSTVLEEALRERGRDEGEELEFRSRAEWDKGMIMSQVWRGRRKSKVRWKSKEIKLQINVEMKEGIVGEDERVKYDDK